MPDQSQPKGANTEFPTFSAGQSAGDVLSAAYQNKIAGALNRLSQVTFGPGTDGLTTGPVAFKRGYTSRDVPAGWIRVQNNYPFRLEAYTPVGIDYPIISQNVDDFESLVEFVRYLPTYSCMAAQARHRNRVAILQEPLMTGEQGWAVLEGLTKAVFHEANPINQHEYELDTSDPTPILIQSEEQASDVYRHLSIAGADWQNEYGTEQYVYGPDDTWGPRFRPKYLFSAANSDFGNTGDAEFSNTPFARSSDLVQPPTSKGRIQGINAWRIPEVTPEGSSSATCIDGAWLITEYGCSAGSSSWFGIELGVRAAAGLVLPCTEGDVVDDIPCYEIFPSNDEPHQLPNDTVTGMNGISGSPYGGSDSFNHRYMIGNVIMGSAADHVWSDAAIGSYGPDFGVDPQITSDISTPCSLQQVYDVDGASAVLEAINRCCANLTCTYAHEDDGSWSLARGVQPYQIGEWDPGSGKIGAFCICPNSIVNARQTKEFANTRLKELTLGMVFWKTSTTTTTTSSTTTTTAPAGICCRYTLEETVERGPGEGPTPYRAYDSCSVEYEEDCPTILPTEEEPSGQYWTINFGDDAPGCTLCYGACCYETYGECEVVVSRNDCDAFTNYGIGIQGGVGTYYGGLDCSEITCPFESTTTTTTTTTTSTTTTTTADPTTTTTSTTTTTTTASSSTTTSSTTTTTADTSSTTTSSTTTTTEGSSSTTTSSTTTTTASCSAPPNFCYYTCTSGVWVNTSQVGCTGPCGCTADSGDVAAICGACDGPAEGDVCGDSNFCV